MLKRYRLWFILLILAIIMVGTILLTGNYIISIKTPNVEASNLLLGALITLLFTGTAYIIGKVISRSVKHYNSLVTLSTQLNEMIGVIKDNVFLLPKFKSALLTGNIFFGTLRPLVIDKTHLISLYDIDLINDIFEFYITARKINDDIENVQSGYEDIKHAYIQKYINVTHYTINGKGIIIQLELIEKGYDSLLEKIISLLSKIRIQIERDKPLTSALQERLIFTSGKDITIKEFKKEKGKLEKELEESSKKSRKEIEKIYGGKN